MAQLGELIVDVTAGLTPHALDFEDKEHYQVEFTREEGFSTTSHTGLCMWNAFDETFSYRDWEIPLSDVVKVWRMAPTSSTKAGGQLAKRYAANKRWKEKRYRELVSSLTTSQREDLHRLKALGIPATKVLAQLGGKWDYDSVRKVLKEEV